MSDLFRPEAVQALQQPGFGRIVLLQPITFTLVAAFSLVIFIGLLLVLALGSYTQKVNANGQLQPVSGVVKVSGEQLATLRQVMVHEGDTVRAGQVLFVLSTEKENAQGQAVHAGISEAVQSRLDSLNRELAVQANLLNMQLTADKQKLEQLEHEQNAVDAQMQSQLTKIELAHKIVDRYTQLNKTKYISDIELQQQQAMLLDQNARLEDLKRNKVEIGLQMQTVKDEIQQIPAKLASQQAPVHQQISTDQAQLLQNESQREIRIVSPVNGMVSALLQQQGQVVSPGQAICTLVPSGVPLHAELLIPSDQIGLVRAGNQVVLRYDNYPYQKYGLQKGTVTSVSHNAFNPADLGISMKDPVPLYRVLVSLPQQQVHAYGKNFVLQAGASLKADILVQKKKIYEWLLDPLLAATGHLWAL